MLTAYTSFGKNHHHFDSLDSTNTFAQELLSKSSPMDGTVISAAFQTHGKGQFDRKWLSNPGENLCFSIILYPEFLAPSRQFALSMAVALAVSEALEVVSGLEIAIKWPNDIYHKNQKLGGILIVNQMMGMKWSSSVVGIGINVNQTIFDDSLPNPGSLLLASQERYEPAFILSQILERLERIYNQQLKHNELEKIRSAYHQQLKGWKEEVRFQPTEEGAAIQTGTILGVDEPGRLLIDHQGQVIAYGNGEVKLIF